MLSLRNLSKRFANGGETLPLFEGLDLALTPGETCLLLGQSGCGKSTLLNLIAGLLPPDEGEVWLGETRLDTLPVDERARLRGRHFGIVYQDFNLLPTLTVEENLCLPLAINQLPRHQPEIDALLARLDLAHKRHAWPEQLSGGQRQRVNIARNLAVEAEVVLADEPTSMLDVSIRIGILNLMEQMKNELGVSMLYITHDIATARYVAEDLAVMYVGHMVEWGEVDEILHHPQHPYTQLLISAVPDPEKSIHAELEGGRKGEIPLWTPESRGCPFAGRCHQAMPRCKESLPPVTRLADNHFVRCYLHEQG